MSGSLDLVRNGNPNYFFPPKTHSKNERGILMYRKISFVMAVILFLILGVSITSIAITFGEKDGDEHPYVGTILFIQNGIGFYSCSGTLISPTVILTAGHCTEESGITNDITYVRFAENAFGNLGDYASVQDWLDNEWILASEVIPHPDYDDFSQFPQTFDVGLVILSEPVYLDEYGILPEEGLLESVLSARGNSTNWWTVVGYGVQGILNPFYQDDYARYRATTRLIELKSTYNGPGASAKFTNNPGRGKGGTCFGDSGGPIFFQNTRVIGAIVSWGITPCIGVDYQFRSDTESSLDFITSNLP